MKQPDDELYLEHIRECIELIEEYMRDTHEMNAFLADRKT